MTPHRTIRAVATGLLLSLAGLAFAAPPDINPSAQAMRGLVGHAHALSHTANRFAQAGCPPGATGAGCLPPGQTKAGAGVVVGQVLNLKRAHIVSHPGRYGLGNAPSGNRYAIVGGHLVRVDAGSGKVLSILRMVDDVLD